MIENPALIQDLQNRITKVLSYVPHELVPEDGISDLIIGAMAGFLDAEKDLPREEEPASYLLQTVTAGAVASFIRTFQDDSKYHRLTSALEEIMKRAVRNWEDIKERVYLFRSSLEEHAKIFYEETEHVDAYLSLCGALGALFSAPFVDESSDPRLTVSVFMVIGAAIGVALALVHDVRDNRALQQMSFA